MRIARALLALTVVGAGVVTITSLPHAAAAPQVDLYPHVFNASSPFYQKLPADAPVDPQSAAKIAAIKEAGINAYGAKDRGLPSMTLNVNEFTNAMYVAHNSDPVYDIKFFGYEDKVAGGCPTWAGNGWEEEVKGVHIPDNARPSDGTDHQMTIYNADTKRYVDLWITRKVGNTWTACAAGNIADASTSNGVFQSGGTSASGIALDVLTVKASELQAGHIDHPIAMSLPSEVVNKLISVPAKRTDGDREPGSTNVSEAQYLRLPKSVDVDSLGLAPVARTIAHAAQDYGFLVVDRSGAISMSLESSAAVPPGTYDKLFEGLDYWNVMWGGPGNNIRYKPFPFEKLEVIQANYVPQGKRPSPAPTPKSTPSPTSSASAPAKTPNVWSYVKDNNEFGFGTDNMCDKCQIDISWLRDGQRQNAKTTRDGWYAGNQGNWSHATAMIRDANGRVVSNVSMAEPKAMIVVTDHNGDSFGFAASSVPQGGRMEITWKRGGQDQSTKTSAPAWFSGTQAGYTDAVATVYDASGQVVAKSETISHT